jgi:hypothetical protein
MGPSGTRSRRFTSEESARYRSSKHFAVEGEEFVLKRAGIVRDHVSGQAPAVHWMDPLWVEFLDPVHHPADGLFRRKDANLLIKSAHHLA